MINELDFLDAIKVKPSDDSVRDALKVMKPNPNSWDSFRVHNYPDWTREKAIETGDYKPIWNFMKNKESDLSQLKTDVYNIYTTHRKTMNDINNIPDFAERTKAKDDPKNVERRKLINAYYDLSVMRELESQEVNDSMLPGSELEGYALPKTAANSPAALREKIFSLSSQNEPYLQPVMRRLQERANRLEEYGESLKTAKEAGEPSLTGLVAETAMGVGKDFFVDPAIGSVKAYLPPAVEAIREGVTKPAHIEDMFSISQAYYTASFLTTMAAMDETAKFAKESGVPVPFGMEDWISNAFDVKMTRDKDGNQMSLLGITDKLLFDEDGLINSKYFADIKNETSYENLPDGAKRVLDVSYALAHFAEPDILEGIDLARLAGKTWRKADVLKLSENMQKAMKKPEVIAMLKEGADELKVVKQEVPEALSKAEQAEMYRDGSDALKARMTEQIGEAKIIKDAIEKGKMPEFSVDEIRKAEAIDFTQPNISSNLDDVPNNQPIARQFIDKMPEEIQEPLGFNFGGRAERGSVTLPLPSKESMEAVGRTIQTGKRIAGTIAESYKSKMRDWYSVPTDVLKRMTGHLPEVTNFIKGLPKSIDEAKRLEKAWIKYAEDTASKYKISGKEQHAKIFFHLDNTDEAVAIKSIGKEMFERIRTAPVSKMEQGAINDYKVLFDRWADEIDAVRIENGYRPINRRNNYITNTFDASFEEKAYSFAGLDDEGKRVLPDEFINVPHHRDVLNYYVNKARTGEVGDATLVMDVLQSAAAYAFRGSRSIVMDKHLMKWHGQIMPRAELVHKFGKKYGLDELKLNLYRLEQSRDSDIQKMMESQGFVFEETTDEMRREFLKDHKEFRKYIAPTINEINGIKSDIGKITEAVDHELRKVNRGAVRAQMVTKALKDNPNYEQEFKALEEMSAEVQVMKLARPVFKEAVAQTKIERNRALGEIADLRRELKVDKKVLRTVQREFNKGVKESDKAIKRIEPIIARKQAKLEGLKEGVKSASIQKELEKYREQIANAQARKVELQDKFDAANETVSSKQIRFEENQDILAEKRIQLKRAEQFPSIIAEKQRLKKTAGENVKSIRKRMGETIPDTEVEAEMASRLGMAPGQLFKEFASDGSALGHGLNETVGDRGVWARTFGDAMMSKYAGDSKKFMELSKFFSALEKTAEAAPYITKPAKAFNRLMWPVLLGLNVASSSYNLIMGQSLGLAENGLRFWANSGIDHARLMKSRAVGKFSKADQSIMSDIGLDNDVLFFQDDMIRVAERKGLLRKGEKAVMIPFQEATFANRAMAGYGAFRKSIWDKLKLNNIDEIVAGKDNIYKNAYNDAIDEARVVINRVEPSMRSIETPLAFSGPNLKAYQPFMRSTVHQFSQQLRFVREARQTWEGKKQLARYIGATTGISLASSHFLGYEVLPSYAKDKILYGEGVVDTALGAAYALFRPDDVINIATRGNPVIQTMGDVFNYASLSLKSVNQTVDTKEWEAVKKDLGKDLKLVMFPGRIAVERILKSISEASGKKETDTQIQYFVDKFVLNNDKTENIIFSRLQKSVPQLLLEYNIHSSKDFKKLKEHPDMRDKSIAEILLQNLGVKPEIVTGEMRKALAIASEENGKTRKLKDQAVDIYEKDGWSAMNTFVESHSDRITGKEIIRLAKTRKVKPGSNDE